MESRETGIGKEPAEGPEGCRVSSQLHALHGGQRLHAARPEHQEREADVVLQADAPDHRARRDHDCYIHGRHTSSYLLRRK